MSTVVTIPPPIRVDVDEEDVPHVFDSVTTEPFNVPNWTDDGELEVVFPTVDLTGDQINDVIRIARQQPMIFDPDNPVPLPPQMIPGSGWDYLGNIYADQIIGGHVQFKVTVTGELYIANYLTDEAGETTPDPTSGVIKQTPDGGIQLFAPTGEFDGEGEPLYREAVELRTIPLIDDTTGKLKYAIFRGSAEFDDAAVKRLVISGNAAAGERSHVAAGAEFRIDNVVADPANGPSVTFGPIERRWPGVANQYDELGWGLHDGYVVQARISTDSESIDHVQARFIDATTGILHHTTTLTIGFAKVAGFTAGGGKLYVHAKFLSSTPHQIIRFDPDSGVFDGTSVVAPADAASVAALGFDGGNVLLLGLGGSSPNIRRYGTGLALQQTITLTGFSTTLNAIGVGTNWIAYGNEWAWLTGSGGSRGVERPDDSDPSSRGWTSRCGSMKGAGALPSGQLAATNQSGTLYAYNGDKLNGNSTLWTPFTKKDTTTGRETLMSPVTKAKWPARQYATIQVSDTFTGTNDVEVYAGSISAARTNLRVVTGMAVGQTRVVISQAPTTGANPPSVSGFIDPGTTTPGVVLTETAAPDGKALTYAYGDGRFRAMKALQHGSVTVGTTLNSNRAHDIVFAVPFAAVPSIYLTVGPGADPQQIGPLVVRAKSITGFTFAIRRLGGSGDVTVEWQASAKTQ